MRKICSVLSALIIAGSSFMIPMICRAENTESEVAFYVAPDGDDNNEGTIDSPLATMQGARDRVRSYKKSNGYPANGITVYFRDGKYPITERVDFDKSDSGTQEAPVVYRAYGDEKPTFTGGYYVSGADFKPVTDEEVLSRFPSDDAREHILQYNLKENGIEDYGTIPVSCGTGKDVVRSETFGRKPNSMEVFIDDFAYDLARYPNKEEDSDKGWLYAGEVIEPGYADDWWKGVQPKFHYSDTRIENWKDYNDVHISGFLGVDYFVDDTKVKAVNKTSKTVTLSDQLLSGVAEGKRYYFYNVLDELDAPGEYYIDRTNGILYLYPTKDISNATVALSGYQQQLMLNLKDVSFMNFKNLTFELTRCSVIGIIGGDSVNVSCCTFKNIGIRAVWIGDTYAGENVTGLDLEGDLAKEYDNAANGINHSVTSCEFFNLGYGAVNMEGGDYYRKIPSNFSVINCKIHDFGRRNKGYENGINYYGNGYIIRNNLIYNAPNAAMIGRATDVYMEYNEMYNVAREISDNGAVYTNYTWPVHDFYFRYNYIHDLPGSNYGHTYFDGPVCLRAGFYTDTNFFSPNLYGNIFANMPIGFHHSGVTEYIENNIFIDCDLDMAAWIDTSWLKGWTGEEARYYTTNNFKYIRRHPWDSEIWRNAAPEFFENTFDKWMAREDSSGFMGTIIRNLSVFINKPEQYEFNHPEMRLRFSESSDYIYEDNVVTKEDPGFVDMKNGNYQLKEDAPIFDLLPEFKRIDISKIGLLTETVGAEAKNEVVVKKSFEEAAKEVR